MNLYKYYRNDEHLLDGEYKAFDQIPSIFWDKLISNPEELKRREKYIAKSSEHAFYYAQNFIKGPWPEGEDAIAKSAEYSLEYAETVLHGRFIKGEKAIMLDSNFSDLYDEHVAKGPWLGSK